MSAPLLTAMPAPMPTPAGTPGDLQPLRELPLPASVAYWPQTVGWVILLALLVLAALVVAWFAWRRYQKQRYRRLALAELAQIAARMGDAAQRATALADLAGLLKRTALAVLPRERVAALSGDAWLAFLQKTHGFDAQSGALLMLASYGPEARRAAVSVTDAQRLVESAREWIAHHHVEV
ncbi:hypothetical protein LMG28688_02469 [Paraburkholderia caffeinitolerans]|uniref:DUF4381 domain-containing protein n=1 Tax=Paraburkholderia caffeinitolerans TaxID=1723730 RepID=A0A6J5G068_9BURK|nr:MULTISPECIES: DUF4381 domain-containing protein [Paraburkholderia]CAB3787442.1 hypothetical protein LMG28688_02469 [Paraburkholderia caffeinitolerans]